MVGAADNTFWVGPYVMHTTETTAALSWETQQAESTRVEYGREDGETITMEGAPGTMHQLTLEGLRPSTRYRYRACSGDHCTGDLHLTTAPADGSPMRFVAYGDSRSDPETHARVAARIAAERPSLVFNVGDIVADGRIREQYKEMHFDPTRALGQHVPIYVAIGNHEKLAPEFFDYMMFPAQPEDPTSEASYGFRWGDAYFLVMDTTNMFFPAGPLEPPLWKWLQSEMQRSELRSARWRFAFFHYPPHSVCEKDAESDSSMNGVRDHVLPLLHENQFHAVFTGHVHAYERLDHEGMLVLITGGGGAGVETDENCGNIVAESRAFAPIYHHSAVDVGCEETVVRIVDVDGSEYERMIVDRKGAYRVSE